MSLFLIVMFSASLEFAIITAVEFNPLNVLFSIITLDFVLLMQFADSVWIVFPAMTTFVPVFRIESDLFDFNVFLTIRLSFPVFLMATTLPSLFQS